MTLKRMFLAGFALFLLSVALPASPAAAHHDWSAYDTTRTVFLSGSVSDVRWQNPHPEIGLEVPAGLEVPEDLVATGISRELEEIGGRQSLRRAVVPEGAGGSWTIEMESPSFMQGVGMDSPPAVGEPLRVVGFLSRSDPRTLRVEVVVLPDGKTISVRNSAVATLPSGAAATATGSRDTGEASGDSAREGEASGAVAGPGGGDGGTEATGGGASWTERVEANSFSELIRSSRWGYPVIEIAHLMGLAILVGAAALFDARLLGFWRGLPITEAARYLLTPVWMGFGVAVGTGLLMFVTDATELMSNPAFRLKLALIAVAGLNAAAFHVGPFRSAKKWGARTPVSGKVAAVISLVIWAGVVACGRLIAYV